MHVTVVFTTQLKAQLGRGEQSLELNERATVRAAIEQLAGQYPAEFSQLVLQDGSLMPSILISVNDQQVMEDHVLEDHDTLTLLSAISGG